MDPAAVRARSPRIVAAAEAAIEDARPYLQPVVLSRELTVTGHDEDRVRVDGGELVCSPDVAARLASAHRLIVVGATVGQPVDDHAIAVFAADPMHALGVHGVGGAAVEDLAGQACRMLRCEAARGGADCSIACWPGRHGWPTLDAQAQIFALLAPGDEAPGVMELTTARLVRPPKSLSFVIGFGERPLTDDEVCDACGLAPVCAYRGC